MKTMKTLFVVLGSALAINALAQNNNDGVFKSSNDYKHIQSANKPAKIEAENMEYIKPEESPNYKQQNNNADTKQQGLIIKTNKKQQSWSALNNPANYKTQR